MYASILPDPTSSDNTHLYISPIAARQCPPEERQPRCPSMVQVLVQRPDGTDAVVLAPCHRKSCPVCSQWWIARRAKLLLERFSERSGLWVIRLSGESADRDWRRLRRKLGDYQAAWCKIRTADGIWLASPLNMDWLVRGIDAVEVKPHRKARLAREFAEASRAGTHLRFGGDWKGSAQVCAASPEPADQCRPRGHVLPMRIPMQVLREVMERANLDDVRHEVRACYEEVSWRRPEEETDVAYFYDLINFGLTKKMATPTRSQDRRGQPVSATPDSS